MFKVPLLKPESERTERTFEVPGSSLHISYALVGNIPPNFHSSDLRNYFSNFIEADQFDCFHFRHRPQVINITGVKDEPPGSLAEAEVPNSSVSVKASLCSIVRFSSDAILQGFVRKYHGKHWMDKEGNDLLGRCVIQKVKLSSDELQKFCKELRPPQLMPQGNVGTPTPYFLNLIKECRLPPSLVKKLGLEFPRARRYKRYSKVPHNYGTTVEEGEFIEDLPVSGRGHLLSDVYVEKTAEPDREIPSGVTESDDDSDPNADNDRCEDWERHEGLNDDVTAQHRLKERLFEEEIELVWEKGGSGIVWYTDAQYWDAQRGGFDERTSDDLDVDMQGYYEPGAGDKDARDSLEIRGSQLFKNGIGHISVFKKRVLQKPGPRASSPPHPSSSKSIGTFESFTKGIGRKVMQSQGWEEGMGLGKSTEGIKEPISSDGQAPKDKSGLGYYGEKLEYTGKRRRPKHSHAGNDYGLDEDDRVVIGTIYDNPTELDREETMLRSNTHTFIKRYGSGPSPKKAYGKNS